LVQIHHLITLDMKIGDTLTCYALRLTSVK